MVRLGKELKKNGTFFYKERKRTERAERSFIKNEKERKEWKVLLKRTDAQPWVQSRLVIAGMNPEGQAMHDLSFEEYLQQMGEKFVPAAEYPDEGGVPEPLPASGRRRPELCE